MKNNSTEPQDIKWEICTGCGESWPITDLGPYTLCPNCASARNDLDERIPHLTGLFGE